MPSRSLGRVTVAVVCGLIALLGGSCAPAAMKVVEKGRGYVVYLPGVGGWTAGDEEFLGGMQEAVGEGVRVEGYDWTPEGVMRDLDGLRDQALHRRESVKVGVMLYERIRAAGDRPVDVVGHSGGTGIAVWALERLPDGMKVRNVVLMQSALSAGYDLSAAMRHVSGKMYVMVSERDEALPMTELFGTVDGPSTRAAGVKGFSRAYPGLITVRYDTVWGRYGNAGRHVSGLSREMGREVVGEWLR